MDHAINKEKQERGTYRATGVVGELSNKTPLKQSVGTMRAVCNQCDSVFFRFASKIRRAERNYCGKGCADAGKRIEVHTKCRQCGKDMTQNPSLAERVLTCGKECSSARRRKGEDVTRTHPQYKAAVAAAREIGRCCSCDSQKGPWVVRDAAGGAESASLWCRPCHMRDLQADVVSRRVSSDERIAEAIRTLQRHGYKVASC